jgi:hypothetical protein
VEDKVDEAQKIAKNTYEMNLSALSVVIKFKTKLQTLVFSGLNT